MLPRKKRTTDKVPSSFPETQVYMKREYITMPDSLSLFLSPLSPSTPEELLELVLLRLGLVLHGRSRSLPAILESVQWQRADADDEEEVDLRSACSFFLPHVPHSPTHSPSRIDISRSHPDVGLLTRTVISSFSRLSCQVRNDSSIASLSLSLQSELRSNVSPQLGPDVVLPAPAAAFAPLSHASTFDHPVQSSPLAIRVQR